MFDFRKMAVSLSVLSITAATTTTLASAQEAALSEGERQGLAACLVKCPDGDKACNNRCIYLEISNQGPRVERCCARLHQRLSD